MTTLTTSAVRQQPGAVGLHSRPPVILLVEDDRGDQILIREALESSSRPKRIEIVSDGAEAIEYIYNLGRHTGAPRPNLILLDLNMPRLGGREVAAKLKADPCFRSIPIVAFTTSVRSEDVAYCYAVGVNSYVQKPSDFEMLQSVLQDLERYWLEISQLAPFAP